jgi:hypothetical protein
LNPNIVLAERSIRIGLGMLLLASPLLELPTYPFNLLGSILVLTAALGYCPLYGLLSAFRPRGDVDSSPPSLSKRRHAAVQAHSTGN